MRAPVLLASTFLLAGSLLAAPAPAAPLINVQFADPGQYTDASLGGGAATERRVLDIVARHLQDLGQACLPAGASLDITVLDIDLAGRQEWSRQNLRVLRESDWPRVEIAYVFRQPPSPPVTFRERISDMNYLWSGGAARTDPQPLPYERAMLAAWFEKSFCKAGPGAG